MKLMGLGSFPRDSREMANRFTGVVAASFVALIAGVFAAQAQDKPAVNAVTGSGWSAEVTPSEQGGGTASLPEDQLAIIEKVNVYLRKFTDVKGRFIQTNPDSGQQKGVFYMLRPGKMRFDYARPSMMRIVSDGNYLSIEDHDLKTVNRYPLESTPFRMLLVKNVKLQRDARILAVGSSDTSATVTLADGSGKSAGQIQLFFSMPKMVLKEWVITDVQGLKTRVEVLNLNYKQGLDKKLFAPSNIGLANVFNQN